MRILHSKKLIFISKPRCGSTSVRRFLDSQMIAGDEKCDYGNEFPDKPELHPHMSAPAVREYLISKGIDVNEYTTFTITRHPLSMLWSYFNYFKPDIDFQYNYSKSYKVGQLAEFESWLEYGRVGIGLWRVYCPDYITNQDFSPLSLEAHANNKDNVNLIDKVFKLEQLNEFTEWLKAYFGEKIDIGAINQSIPTKIPKLKIGIINKIRKEFTLECRLYDM